MSNQQFIQLSEEAFCLKNATDGFLKFFFYKSSSCQKDHEKISINKISCLGLDSIQKATYANSQFLRNFLTAVFVCVGQLIVLCGSFETPIEQLLTQVCSKYLLSCPIEAF